MMSETPSCEATSAALLRRYVEGLAEPSEEAALEKHIEGCRSCEAALQRCFREQSEGQLRPLQPLELRPIASTWAELASRIEREAAPSHPAAGWKWAVGVAVALFALLPVGWFWQQPPPQDILQPKHQPGVQTAPLERPSIFVGKFQQKGQIARISSGAQVTTKARLVLGFSLIHPGGYGYLYWRAKGAPQLLYPQGLAKRSPARKLQTIGQGDKAGVFGLADEPPGEVELSLLQTRQPVKDTSYAHVRSLAIGVSTFRLTIQRAHTHPSPR